MLKTKEEINKSNREYRAAHPERVREWEKRKRDRIFADPEKLAALRKRQRLYAREYRKRAYVKEREAAYSKSERGREVSRRSSRAHYYRNREQEVRRVMESRKRTGYDYKKSHPGWIQKYMRTSHGRYNSLKTSARDRNLELNIKETDFVALIEKPCHYCGASLGGFTGSGLDRLDNSKGYVYGNVVPCCKYCNRVRSNVLTPDEMLAAMAAVKRVRLEKALDGVGAELEQEDRTYLTA